MIFTALFIAYFFPPRLAWPLMALFVYAFATPLFYDNARALDVGYPARLVMFGLAVAGTHRRRPVPQGPPRARRAAPAHDGRARPAHRGGEPARLRPGARARGGDRRPLRAHPYRPRRLQARERRAGPSRRGRRAAVRGHGGRIRGPAGRLPRPDRRRRVRADRARRRPDGSAATAARPARLGRARRHLRGGRGPGRRRHAGRPRGVRGRAPARAEARSQSARPPIHA